MMLLAVPLGLMAEGTSWGDAIAIAQGETGSCSLNDDQKDGYFKIEIPEEGSVKITMTTDGDLNMNWVELYWYKAASDDYSSRESTGWYPENGKVFEMTDAGKGTYYLRAQRRSGKGTCTLKYEFTACPKANDGEPNDDKGSGDVLVNGETVEGRLGYKDDSGYRDENDWYKIEVPEDGTVELEYDLDQTYELKLNWMDFRWYKASNNDYPSRASTGWYPSDNGKLAITNVSVGTYYIQMQRRSGHGGYTLKYTFTPSSFEKDAEPNDNKGEGTEIAIGETVQGHLGFRDATDNVDDNDWYKIEVPGDGRIDLVYDLDQTNELAINWMDVRWYKASNDDYPSRESTGWYPKANDTLSVTNAGKGTYYIQMQRKSGHGGYTLKYLFTPSKYSNDSEPNDEKGQGDEIAMGGTVQGHLGYRDATDYVDDNDWYKIVVPEDGRVDLIYNCEQTYELKLNWMDFRWYKASNNDYPSRESTGWYPNPSDTLTIDDAGKGTYYIQMQRKSGHGGYTLKYVFTRNSTPVDEEPNNEADQVTQVIENDGIATGHLGYRDENDNTDKDDWFKLDTRNSGVMLVVTIETDSISNLAFNWVDIIRVKDGKSNSVASSGWYPTGKISITTNEVDEDATYYVHLQHKSGHGSYTVSYGSPQRYEGSQIRITYLGRNTTRLGIPSPYDVKVENIGSGNTGSFFIAIPATPDIEFLSASIPTEFGVMEVDRDEFAVYDEKEGDCAVFIMNNLGPYESYQFTVNMQGRVEGASTRAEEVPEGAFPIKAKGQSILGALKSEAQEFEDNFEWEAAAEDGISVATVQAAIDTWFFDEKDRRDFAQAIGPAQHEYRQSYRQPVASPVTHYTQKVGEKLVAMSNPIMAGYTALRASGQIANSLVTALRRKLWLWIYKDLGYVKDDPQVMDGTSGTNGVVRSWDPNEMVGPMGYGDEHYIGETKTIDYRILFENKAEATDNAYRIHISDELDENVFDVSTVRFGKTSHDGPEYNWKMNREGNKLTWDIEGIELPPNVNAPEGEGCVTFSVDLKPGLKNGTQIRNKAAIIFDSNETIETNEFVNTLDIVEPTAEMKSFSMNSKGQYVVNCSGSDDDSGISHYLFYVSANGDEYKYLGQNTEPSYALDIEPSTDYDFIAFAVDNVGNIQKAIPEPVKYDPTGISTVAAVPEARWAIYNLKGVIVASGEGISTKQLPAGVYIERRGNDVRKVIIK